MANNMQKKSAASGTTRTNTLSRGRESFQCVVYDDFSGFPLSVTFLGNRWWVTTPGVKLQPLEDYFEGGGINFYYLTEAGGRVGALALARMLAKALENPEDAVDMCLRKRVDSLKRMGVTLDVKDEQLMLELETSPNIGNIHRQGNYSVSCCLAGNDCDELFDIDAFDSKKDAEKWVSYYFNLLEELGIVFSII